MTGGRFTSRTVMVKVMSSDSGGAPSVSDPQGDRIGARALGLGGRPGQLAVGGDGQAVGTDTTENRDSASPWIGGGYG